LLDIVEWEKTARTLKFKNCCNFGTPYSTWIVLKKWHSLRFSFVKIFWLAIQ
jgi:hypothetical protein